MLKPIPKLEACTRVNEEITEWFMDLFKQAYYPMIKGENNEHK